MAGTPVPQYVGVMAEQCGGCVACGACGADWAALVLLAVGVYLVNPK